jgi:hypothetical protein
MSDAIASGVLDNLLGLFSRCLDAESAARVAQFRVAPEIQKQVESLAERANEGLLSEDESAEYEALVNASDFITILKLKALRNLESNQNQ